MGFSDPQSSVLSSVDSIVSSFTSSGNNVGLGISFIFLTVILTLLYRQGTDKLFKGFRRGSIASSIILAIFSSVGLLSQFVIDKYPANPFVVIGLSLLNTFLIVVIIGGAIFVYSKILSNENIKQARLLLLLAFTTFFLYLITIFIEHLAQSPSIYQGLGSALSNTSEFLSLLIVVSAILAIIATLFSFFNNDSFMEVFNDPNDEEAIAKKQKEKQKKEEEQNMIEKLEQLKKSLHKMRNTYDEKTDTLKQISKLESISDITNSAEEIPSQSGYDRGFANSQAPSNGGVSK
jgi:glucan phosphoethanolaminetransferase (alkaline phosphatase superfamily)